MIFLGFLIIAFLYVANAWIGAGLDSSLLLMVLSGDPFTFLFVMSGLAGYVLIYGRKEFVRGMKTFFAFSFLPDDEAGRFFQQLTTFTVRWGLLGMLLGLASVMIDLDPDRMGFGVSISLFSVLYTLGLAGFVFLPIGLRLSPSETYPSFCKMAVNLSLTGLAVFVLLAGIRILADLDNFSTDLFHLLGPHIILLYLNIPSLVLVVGSWGAFRLASGKRRQGIAAPVMILIGVFWSIQGFVLMLSDFEPEHLGAGSVIALLTTLYAFLAAAGFLIADMWNSFRDPPPVPPAEGTEQAKEIIDRAVEDVQKRRR